MFHTRRLFSKKGMTLSELLIATILMGIVIIGITSFHFAIKRLEESTSTSSAVTTKAAALLAMIKKDALETVGTAPNSGVRTIQDTSNNNEYHCLCLRLRDVDPLLSKWVCYLHEDDFIIHRYADVNPGAVPCVDAATCADNVGAGGAIMRNLLELEDLNVGGGFFNIMPAGGCGACPAGTMNTMDHINITFTAIQDTTQPYDPLSNPRTSLTTNISPPGHSSN